VVAEIGTSRSSHAAQAGYSLIELMVAITVLLIVSGTVFDGMLRLTRVNDTISNRTEMHSGVRNATELLSQEVGQAGRISLPGNVTLLDPVLLAGPATVRASSVAGMFVGEQLVIDTGGNQETVAITAVDSVLDTFTANFGVAHAVGSLVSVQGGFSAGIVPTTIANGSTGTASRSSATSTTTATWCTSSTPATTPGPISIGTRFRSTPASSLP
jgi:prepilin-type N-terminal cleavage/methylation domain-containing protein